MVVTPITIAIIYLTVRALDEFCEEQKLKPGFFTKMFALVGIFTTLMQLWGQLVYQIGVIVDVWAK